MMKWAIHRVSLVTHDLDAAVNFFADHIGLGVVHRTSHNQASFGSGSRGLRLIQPSANIVHSDSGPLVSGVERHVAVEVEDLNGIKQRLDAVKHPYTIAPAGDFESEAIYTVDPALNVVAFCATENVADEIHPWEQDWGWGIHHVNLQAGDVRKTISFYTSIIGMAEGQWRAPASMGDFSIDPAELAILALNDLNRGLHIIKPDPGFAIRNQFAHNPSIGGHPAFWVGDVAAVKANFESDGVLVSDAKVYAMVGMHQIYAMDPTANIIEINQFV